ncbi:MAG TPA: hypothetical protein PKY77_18320 [Phycisphaerae bacterium]|nr:hypothetical protein [Phycisphaerae bacterium]HRY70293.1 hypothetical protein [Phycisphaerae bacterium]HSA27536.1 hypothetical protein [Phycisphaerae bacterium]
MRALGIIIVALAAAVLVASWLQRAGSTGEDGFTFLPVRELHVTGAGNTLTAVARQVNNPNLFSYDPATRIAVAHATLIVEGELLIGRPDTAGPKEVLELATEVCGDLRIEVRSSGTLQIHRGAIRTVSQVLSTAACSRGFALFVDGKLDMDHGSISYMSGSTSQCLRGKARATIRDSSFSYCDGSALSCVNVDGQRVAIERSEILSSGNWGLVVQGCGGAPLEVRDSVLEAQLGAVFMTGQSPAARLVDCTFDPAKILFNGPDGGVEVAWTRRFRVVGARDNQPKPGLCVQARGTAGPSPAGTIETRTGADGVAELTLIESTVRPGIKEDSTARSTPRAYRLAVIGDDAGELATMANYVPRGKDREPVTITVP